MDHPIDLHKFIPECVCLVRERTAGPENSRVTEDLEEQTKEDLRSNQFLKVKLNELMVKEKHFV